MPRHSTPQRPSRVRPRLVVTLAVALTGLGAAVWLPMRNATADASERRRNEAADFQRGRERTPNDAFEDQFDGGAGSTVDPAKWAFSTSRTDEGLEFTMSTRNARLDGDGNLLVTARDGRGRTSARLTTKDIFQRESGRIEARVQVPEGEGLEPALELTGGGRPDLGTINLLKRAEPGDFHTYAVTWTPETITFSVDGEDRQQFPASGVETDQPFGMALSLGASDRADLPARMVVDFIRVTAAGDDENPAPAPSETASPEPAPSATTEPPAAPSSPSPSAPASASPTPSATPTTPAVAAWAAFTDYKAGDVVSFQGAKYEVLEAHTSLPGWEPTALPSLFKKL
ncbi:carbohydrate-binding protein [Actinoplanes sp. TFC3]|uniref:carbohydrate-binding protein n=1 Tax=Actinoplanes sp. TFC3 TaxID=1710355 RepID=UPI00082A9151|nr:carbohydrate-binding protein [Actinoplanes sp. TFC3]